MLPQSSGNFVVKLFGQLPLQIVLIIFLVLPITGTVWLLEYLSFEDEADTGHEFLLSVAVLLIGSVHCIVIAQWITLPILQLSAIAKAIEQGQWDKTVTINHFYELVQLAESFNRVFAQLRDVTENAEQRVQERTAQLVLVNEQLQHEIAERKQVEQALQAREGLLNAILQNLPLDFFVRDKFERLIMQSAHSIQRYVIGTLPEEANIDPQTLAVWKENNRRVFRGETVRGEFEREVDGQLRLFYEIKAPMYIEGRIEGLVGFSLDITDHKQAEEALRQANEQLQQRVNELTSLNFVAQTVATITDLPTTLKIVAETMIHLFDSQRIAIALLDAAQSGLKVVTHQAVNGDGDSFVGLTLPLASTPTAKQVLETGQIMVIPNLQTSLLTTPILDFLRAQGAQCLMLVPLLARAEIIGVIYLATNEAGRVFTPTQVTLAQTIAAQIAGAIETARRFDQERRQRQIADSLREVATILNSSLDQPIVLTRILEQLARVIPNDGSGIFLQQDEALLLVGGIGPAARTNLNARLPLASQNPTARVFKTQQLIIITDLNTEPHWLIWPEGHLVRSWMGAPLIVGQQVIGALTVDNFKVGAYHEEDGQILQTFANQAALAIQNARLFEALRRYERIVSATPDGISLLDRNYVYQIVNQTYLNASNKSRDQVVGHTVSELLSEEVFEKVVKAELDEALAGETVHYQAWFDYPALGRRFISVTYYP
ncbi:MAG: GAF domain-containing protein, partial [Chloroflexi bacterium]|nr:GAF domain-containing protein [Chloroflexota bacterium]